MIKTFITEFPLTDVPKERTVTEEKIRKYTYTKDEVDVLINAAVEKAVAEARRIDEESMAKHNRDATVISMILGFTINGILFAILSIHFFLFIILNRVYEVNRT